MYVKCVSMGDAWKMFHKRRWSPGCMWSRRLHALVRSMFNRVEEKIERTYWFQHPHWQKEISGETQPPLWMLWFLGHVWRWSQKMQKKYKNGWGLDQTRISSLATFMGITGCVQGFLMKSGCAGDEMIESGCSGHSPSLLHAPAFIICGFLSSYGLG